MIITADHGNLEMMRDPETGQIVTSLGEALDAVTADRLWVNPDCGLKTRGWEETTAALKVMVDATRALRAELGLKAEEIEATLAGKKTAKQALDEWGFGMASVRFICGTQEEHKQLEARISSFLGLEDTILYSSCFDANGGLFETLLGEEDAIISDALNHASLIDGIRLSKAARFRYANADLDDLRTQLQRAEHLERHVRQRLAAVGLRHGGGRCRERRRRVGGARRAASPTHGRRGAHGRCDGGYGPRQRAWCSCGRGRRGAGSPAPRRARGRPRGRSR